MCAFSQEHTLLKQLFQQNWINDCGKKGTNKPKKIGQNEMVAEKTTTLSSQAENANMRLHLA